MELLAIIVKLVFIFAVIILAVWWWVTWLGMHKNTITGDCSWLMYPFAIFDKRQFTDKGNYWRRKHISVYAILILLIFIAWMYTR